MPFSLTDMSRFATEAWGPLGAHAVERWEEFNRRYFDGALRPVPMVITNTLPYGRLLAFCSYVTTDGVCTHGRTITLNVPAQHDVLVADNCTLLHEMIHQFLFERGEDAAHAGAGWKREIMRIHYLMTGREIWAGRSTTGRREVDGVKKVVRFNVPHPTTGARSLTQMQIARWPHDQAGITLGQLGSETQSIMLRTPEAA